MDQWGDRIDNLAIRGLLEGMANATGRRKIITMETEHKAVLDTCAHLIDAQVVYLKPDLMDY